MIGKEEATEGRGQGRAERTRGTTDRKKGFRGSPGYERAVRKYYRAPETGCAEGASDWSTCRSVTGLLAFCPCRLLPQSLFPPQ